MKLSTLGTWVGLVVIGFSFGYFWQGADIPKIYPLYSGAEALISTENGVFFVRNAKATPINLDPIATFLPVKAYTVGDWNPWPIVAKQENFKAIDPVERAIAAGYWARDCRARIKNQTGYWSSEWRKRLETELKDFSIEAEFSFETALEVLNRGN